MIRPTAEAEDTITQILGRRPRIVTPEGVESLRERGILSEATEAMARSAIRSNPVLRSDEIARLQAAGLAQEQLRALRVARARWERRPGPQLRKLMRGEAEPYRS